MDERAGADAQPSPRPVVVDPRTARQTAPSGATAAARAGFPPVDGPEQGQSREIDLREAEERDAAEVSLFEPPPRRGVRLRTTADLEAPGAEPITTASDVASAVDPDLAARFAEEERLAREQARVDALRAGGQGTGEDGGTDGWTGGADGTGEDGGPAATSEPAYEPGYEDGYEDEYEEIDLLGAAERLRGDVAALTLPFAVPGQPQARRTREELLAQLDDYLLPRLRRMDAPLLAVVGGSTGAGKSTLVNSLLQREVTRSGVLRPTTRSPVLVHHPHDSGAFLSQRILPGLARVTSEAPEPMQPIDVDAERITGLRLVPHEGLTPGLALVDAPDIDSVVETNRDLAVQLLAAADLWLFVTTAARYADAVPWSMLRQAVERGVSVAIVLDRVPPEAMQEIRSHLATMLRDRGLGTSPMFTVPESPTQGGLLAPEVVAPLWTWLNRLASDARARDVVVRRTLVGALDSLRDRVDVLARAADEQASADRRLREELEVAFASRRRELTEHVSDGSLLRGEVLARWQEFVGTGEFVRSLEATVSRLRDRVTAAFRGRPAPEERLEESLHTGLAAMVRAGAQGAIEDTANRWRMHDAGRALLEDHPGEARLAPGFESRLERMVRDWQRGVLELVRTQGESKRSTARALSFGVNGAGVVLMLVTFSQTAGLTGAEVGVAAGTAAVAQKLLEALFGDQAMRSLAEVARKDLVGRVEALLEGERQRLQALVDGAGVRPARGEALRYDAQLIEETR